MVPVRPSDVWYRLVALAAVHFAGTRIIVLFRFSEHGTDSSADFKGRGSFGYTTAIVCATLFESVDIGYVRFF